MIETVRTALASLAVVVSAMSAGATELVMVHQLGCHYCERWTAEIGPIYPRTAEGAFAPLRRVELGGAEMDKLALKRRVNFTPTFVLVDDTGTEMARMEGYPGEDFFWGLLERMLLDQTAYERTPDSG